MRKILTCCLCAVTMALCLSCGSDDEEVVSGGGGIVGWYCTEMAVPSDFDDINEAIANNELLSEYGGHGTEIRRYYATRDLFVTSEGDFIDHDDHMGRLQWSLGISKTSLRVIRIVDNSTLIRYNGHLAESGSTYASQGTIVGRIYAGHVFGNMDYCDQSDGQVYTYIRIDNKIVTSIGEVYTFVDGALLPDGSSMSNAMRKYDPTVRYGSGESNNGSTGDEGNTGGSTGEPNNSTSIVGTWRDDWGSDLNYDYTAFSFFEDGTGLYFDKGNPGKRFTYTYSLSPQFVEIAYNEYYKEQLAISKLTSNVLILDEEEYKKSELTYSMLIIGKWRLHVDVENSDEEQKSVVSFSPSGWYETKDYVGWSVGNSLGELQGTYSGEWSINGDRLLIEGESRIAGEYIIEGLVVNGCRLVRASNPDEYPYLIGGWYDR